MKNFTPILGAVIFFLMGVLCLFWPEKVQGIALRIYSSFLGKINPFLPWMKTQSYIMTLRIMGVFFLVIAIFTMVIIIHTLIFGV